jgi:hypothetical protein
VKRAVPRRSLISPSLNRDRHVSAGSVHCYTGVAAAPRLALAQPVALARQTGRPPSPAWSSALPHCRRSRTGGRAGCAMAGCPTGRLPASKPGTGAAPAAPHAA